MANDKIEKPEAETTSKPKEDKKVEPSKPNTKKPPFQGKGKGRGGGPKGPTQSTLPKPSNTEGTKNPTPPKDEPLYKDSIFGVDMCLQETNMRTKFKPAMFGLIPTATMTFQSMRADDANVDKQMLESAFRYYTTGLAWLRMVHLKRATAQTLTAEEQTLLEICASTEFHIPEPVYIYLSTYGVIKDVATGQVLIPEFPQLPTEVIGEFGGFYGNINDETHNLYEEIPCLGVAAENLRQSLSNAPPGTYNTNIPVDNIPGPPVQEADDEDAEEAPPAVAPAISGSAIRPANQVNAPRIMTVNENLLGWVPLGFRRSEAKGVFQNIGIFENEFSENIARTGFNYEAMFLISEWVSKNKTFKVHTMKYTAFPTSGSQAGLTFERPLLEPMTVTRQIKGPIICTSLIKSPLSIYGVANFNLSQLTKEIPNDTRTVSARSYVWCCVTFTAAIPMRDEWYANRNIRRTLPMEYESQRFRTVSANNTDLRRRIIGSMKAGN